MICEEDFSRNSTCENGTKQETCPNFLESDCMLKKSSSSSLDVLKFQSNKNDEQSPSNNLSLESISIKLFKNLSSIEDLTDKLEEYVSTVPQQNETIVTSIESNFKNIVRQLEEHKNLLLREIQNNCEFLDLKQTLLDSKEKLEKLRHYLATGDSYSTIQLESFLIETNLLKNKLDTILLDVDQPFIYNEPTFENNLEDYNRQLIGTIEYPTCSNSKLNISRLQNTKYRSPRILSYKSHDNSSDYYTIIDIIVAPLLNSKIVMSSYGCTKLSQQHETNIKMFDYQSGFMLYKESWDLSNCHLYDMITFKSSIIMSIKNEKEKLMIHIYNEYLDLVKSIEHQYFTDSLFANTDNLFLADHQAPFIHAFDWDLNGEIKSFGQDNNPNDAFFMTINDKLLIQFKKVYVLNIKSLLIQIYDLDSDRLFKSINLQDTFSSMSRALISVDNDERLIVAKTEERTIAVCSSIHDDEIKIIYERDLNEELSEISSITVTNDGYILINDSIEKVISLI